MLVSTVNPLFSAAFYATRNTASTSLRLAGVLHVLFQYASTRRPARASYPRSSHAPRDENLVRRAD